MRRAMDYFRDKAANTEVDADRLWIAEAVKNALKADPRINVSSPSDSSDSDRGAGYTGGLYRGTGMETGLASSMGSRCVSL